MKKFIVEFDFAGFRWTARVEIGRRGNAIFYSITLVEDCLSYFFYNKELVFLKDKIGYSLSVFIPATPTRCHQWLPLEWHIRTEYVDAGEPQIEHHFSKS